MLGYFWLFCSIVALIFLIYTLYHLKQWQMPIWHPRVLVELILCVLFLVLGLWYLWK
jgi:multisubunit Na+/H+ antiporter MnhB subunit